MEDIKISYEEKEKFHKAFRQHEFRMLFDEYFDEISDKKYRKEKEDYLLSLYFKGELKKDQILIKPIEAFCVKTKILYSNHTNQRLFLNICSHEGIHSISFGDISRGEVNIPYSLSQIRPDKQGNNVCCLTIDCCVNPLTVNVTRNYNEILNFLLEDVCVNIEKNIMKDKEKICRDFKVLSDMKCKGDKPFLLCINKSVIKKNILIEEEKKLENMKKEFEEKNTAISPNDVDKILQKSKVETEIRKNEENELDNSDMQELNTRSIEVGKVEIQREKKKYFIYHQGTMNTSSFFKLKENKQISLNLPSKIKVLICTDNYVKKNDINIRIEKKILQVKFDNSEEEDVIVHLPYPCNGKDYVCVLKKDKKKIEIYLKLCEEFLKEYADSIYEKYYHNKRVDDSIDSLNYIDDIVDSYQKGKDKVDEEVNEGAEEEDEKEEANRKVKEEDEKEEANRGVEEEARKEGTNRKVEEEANKGAEKDGLTKEAEVQGGSEEIQNNKNLNEETSKSCSSSKIKKNDMEFPPVVPEYSESVPIQELIKNKSEKMLDSSFSFNDKNNFLNCDISTKLKFGFLDDSKCAEMSEKGVEEDTRGGISQSCKIRDIDLEGLKKEDLNCTIKRNNNMLNNGGNTFPNGIKIEMVNDEADLFNNDQVAEKSSALSHEHADKNIGSEFNKLSKLRKKKSQISGCPSTLNDSEYLKDIDMYEHAEKGVIFSCMLWTAYI
ncbi:PIH1 domain-containing protein, putative [Plasmodium malariae]|uniref:PIH1 domain-containing protein, putative n=1 Tax=Plasmodium malariae TaxID=5858 RepID=A0A1D3JMW3_PLAMA|nr:PIH1 domain-containing protein, putative [Plasmodium malariae]SBT87972.1 PIH1 domain-containing protein, putative [Plasmodium malariae]